MLLLFSGGIKIIQSPQAIEGTVKLGYPAGLVFGIGVLELLCTALYVVPRTSILGAIMLTGYLGGAVATHLRVGDPLPSHVLFPVYLGVLIWAGLYLRDPRLPALIPLRQPRTDLSA
jgi:hypothetical protein